MKQESVSLKGEFCRLNKALSEDAYLNAVVAYYLSLELLNFELQFYIKFCLQNPSSVLLIGKYKNRVGYQPELAPVSLAMV